MCAITGILSHQKAILDAIQSMTDTMIHRGPDDSGTWVDYDAGIALGHRRLSIIDLSPLGHQPMHSHSERYVMAYNGEIYNFKAIKKELGEHISWRGESDTEVLLAAIEQWGFEKALQKTVGMFAISLWDRETRELYLARDRFGEKPLYYGKVNGNFVFASELKAIRKTPDFNNPICKNALSAFLRFSYVPAPLCIFEDLHKLMPGTYCIVKSDLSIEHHTYWSAIEQTRAAHTNPFEGSFEQASDQLEQLLMQSIKDKMISDVPLGAMLSGGIDSSTIVALMQAQSSRPINTFSIGFHQKEYNEAEHAKAVAKHLGTNHTELYLTGQDCLDVIPKLPELYDEPFADSSQIPTFLVSQLAKESVTVALTGDGGDELFGGYDRYFRSAFLWQKASKLPKHLREPIFKMASNLPACFFNAFLSLYKKKSSSHVHSDNFGKRIQRLFKGMSLSKSPFDVYCYYLTGHSSPNQFLHNITNESHLFNQLKQNFNETDFFESMMLSDTLTYLPNDILTKVDRAGMGVSLEARIPFLDQHIFEFARSLPLGYQVQGNSGKVILKTLLQRHIPKEMIDRPKMGFGIPLSEWLSGSLKEWANELFSTEKLNETGFLNVESIQKTWKAHCRSGSPNAAILWKLLCFQSWHKQFN